MHINRGSWREVPGLTAKTDAESGHVARTKRNNV